MIRGLIQKTFAVIPMKKLPILIISSFALIGSFLILASQAATPVANIEAENGSLQGVSVVSDGSASSGSAIRFGSGTSQPLAPLTQATMPTFAEAWQLAPTLTITTATSSSVSGSLISPTDSRLKYLGTTGIIQAATTGYYRASYMADKSTAGTGTDPNFLPSYGIKFKTNAPSVEIKMQQRPDLAGKNGVSGRVAVRLRIDGKWTSVSPTYLGLTNTGYDTISNPESITAGTEVWVKLDFGSSSTRTVEFYTMTEFGGIKTGSSYSLSQADPPQHTAVMLGDSLTGAEKHGLGNFSLSSAQGSYHKATFTQLSSLWAYACQTIGYDNVVTSSAGSSGFTVSGDTVSYLNADRMANDVIAYNPELVVIGTSFNDIAGNKSATSVKTATISIISTIHAALPDAIIVVFGNPNAPVLGALAPYIVSPYNTALREAANTNQIAWFIDPSVGRLYNPSGSVMYSHGDLLSGRSSYVSSDDTHPTQAGAELFGKRIGEYLRRVHPAN